MAFLFGGGKRDDSAKANPLREHQNELKHASWSLEREDVKCGLSEKGLREGIVKLAREGKFDQCKAKAKELIRLRAHRQRLGSMRGHMASMAQQLTTIQGAQSMQNVLLKTGKILKAINSKMDTKAVHRMMMEFERQSTAMQMNQEVVEETLDGMFEAESEQEATDDALMGVFHELGLDMAGRMPSAVTRGEAKHGEAAPSVDDMEARLARLKQH